MRRVAANLPNASWHLAGQNPVIGRNDPGERLPEQTRGGRRPSPQRSTSFPSLLDAPFHTQHPRRLTVTRSMRLALLTIFLDVLLLFVSAAGAFRRVRKPDTRK
jgi:hypothetical protein